MKKILITGGNSQLGKIFAEYCKQHFQIVVASTSNNKNNTLTDEWINIAEGYEKLKKVLSECDIIVHFAWSRKSKNNLINLNYTNFLLENKKQDCKFFFVSSVAASPNSVSKYGKQKFEISELVLKKRGINIFLGLVHCDNNNQITSLIKLISFVPFSIRFTYSFFNIYLIELNSFQKKLFNIICKKNSPQNVILYDKIFGINEFLIYLEKFYDKYKKYKIIFPVFFLKTVIFIIKKLNLKFSIFDKILTFSYKDDEWLNKIEK